jgi:carbohydrate-binding DOMON domain-containing protein
MIARKEELGMRRKYLGLLAVVLASAFLAAAASAQEVAFKDPVGDDDGPGNYVYPTDAVYKSGSFDLVGVKLKAGGDNLDVSVEVNSKLEDPWGMGVGFAVQMVFIFIDTDGKAGSGFTAGLPGLNVQFDPAGAWDRCIILSPQSQARVKSEVDAKVAAEMKGAVLVPVRTKGANRTISGSVPLKDLGGGDPKSWGYQVLVQSNEGFPEGTDLLTRKVNEYEGQHRFGGGNDGDCDTHVMDCLAGNGTGAKEEIELQHQMLQFKCKEDGTAEKLATLVMVRPK